MYSEADGKLISVILPVYNGERLLARAIESVAVQRLPPGWKSELIIINDASTDHTAGVIDSCKKKYRDNQVKIRVISHTSNRGAAASQIEGMKAARGEWLARIDHDDVFASDYLESLLTAATHHAAGIAVAPIEMISEAGDVKKRQEFSSRGNQADIADLNNMKLDTTTFSLCNKLIKRDLTNGTELPAQLGGLNCWDDVYILVSMILRESVPIVAAPDAPAYRYTVERNSDSLTHSDSGKISADRIRCAEAILDLIEKKGMSTELTPFIRQLKLRAKVKYLRGKNMCISRWKEVFPMKAAEILRAPNIPMPYLIGMALVQLMPSKNRQPKS